MTITLSEEFSESLQAYLIENKLLKRKEKVYSYSKAGEGNMNFVMRFVTDRGSMILKQSRDFVNKYPQIPAPIERVAVEKAFLNIVNEDPYLSQFSPSVLHFDAENHLLVMEDLGIGSDFLKIYQDHSLISESQIASLIGYLVALHSKKNISFPSNKAMKVLNHEHIFHFPYMVENGFNLDDVQLGLQELAMKYKTDKRLKQEIEKIGKRYLDDGQSLLHGDFYPGSWLKVEEGLKVIDPEFSFVGDPEFDFGVAFAHFEMSGVEEALLNKCLIKQKGEIRLNEKLLNQYKGIEILRRLIGIAQLPVKLSLEQKALFLDKAKTLIL